VARRHRRLTRVAIIPFSPGDLQQGRPSYRERPPRALMSNFFAAQFSLRPDAPNLQFSRFLKLEILWDLQLWNNNFNMALKGAPSF
jgi:hypothetical protein